jgi:hypothetical protein
VNSHPSCRGLEEKRTSATAAGSFPTLPIFVVPRVAGDVSGLQVDPGTESNLQIRGRAINQVALRLLARTSLQSSTERSPPPQTAPDPARFFFFAQSLLARDRSARTRPVLLLNFSSSILRRR